MKGTYKTGFISISDRRTVVFVNLIMLFAKIVNGKTIVNLETHGGTTLAGALEEVDGFSTFAFRGREVANSTMSDLKGIASSQWNREWL